LALSAFEPVSVPLVANFVEFEDVQIREDPVFSVEEARKMYEELKLQDKK
jgi:hypothetical protein